MSPARKVAFDVLLRVERGGFASDLLLARSQGLDTRDAGLASEIVFGALRYQRQLDFLIGIFSGRPPERLDSEVRVALRMGLYQLRYLDRVPAHAVVDESVQLAKYARKSSAAGFVNAVLRKVHREPVTWPNRATELSMPDWLLDRWDRHFGPEVAGRIARASLQPPETYVRVPSGRIPDRVQLEPVEVPGCYRVLGGDPSGLRIQDVGSQTIVPLLDLRAGQAFLDLCAAPGNKTAQALERDLRCVACDVDHRRLALLKTLGCDLVVLDAAQPLPFRVSFDRILLDVPCSGTGTLARNPEIKWRLQPGDLAELHARQVTLLRRALERLAPEGRLVYSTCSLEPEENVQVVEEVLGRSPEQRMMRIPGIDPGDGFFAAVLPSK